RDLGKRWSRLRLTSGLSIGAARAGVDALTRFGDFLALVGVDSLADIDRPLLERYLAHAMSQPGGNNIKKHRIGSLNVFFQAVRQHGWDDSLPAGAAFYTGDTPPIGVQVDRRLAEFVMTQIESPANLPLGRSVGQAGHPDPHPVRSAGFERAVARVRLHRPRRPERPLPALLQHEDETRSRRSHRRRTRSGHRRAATQNPRTMAGRDTAAVPTRTLERLRRHPAR